MSIKLDLYQSVAMAVIVFFIGSFAKRKVKFFEKYCIPAPVIGGIAFALLTLTLNLTNIMTIETDNTMQQVFMTLFFTSIGFTASVKLLKKGGLQVLIFIVVCSVLVILQNLLGVSLATLFGLNPLLGLCTGSISMIGGHGTAGSFGALFDSIGVSGASTVAVASATFGLVVGGMMGGPLAHRLISKKKLETPLHTADLEGGKKHTISDFLDQISTERTLKAFSLLFLAAGLGSIISSLIQMTNITFPSYIGAMLAAALIRNITEMSGRFEIMTDIVEMLGNVCLSLFLSMALMSLKLWQLADLALPLVVMLAGQAVLMAVFAYFVTYNIMGRNYEAAVMSSANCGFGMGATPNAIANMQAITSVFGQAPQAFFIVPLVGSLFIDFANASILTVFVNVLK